MAGSSLVFAGIAPHPPIMVPEVGREAIAEVRGSIDAMRELTERINACGVESIVMISPHAPLEARVFVAYDEEKLYGDFAHFRAAQTKVEAPLDKELLKAITDEAAREGYGVVGIEDYQLDHGTAVPLYFLLRNGWRGRVVALGYNFLSNEDHLRFGSCIKRAIDSLKRPVAFVASGDLSHRLKPDAPAGYNPQAHLFDEEVVESIRDGNPTRIVKIEPNLQRMAGECGYRSMLVAIGATQEIALDCEVLNYEAPFGVGYLVAQIVRTPKTASDEERVAQQSEESNDKGQTAVDDLNVLPALAREAVETFTREGRLIEASAKRFQQRAACFVSIKMLDGDLRGCIGTIEPAKETLEEEVITNAVSAATRDPRFPPVGKNELPFLRYSVDILSPPEPTEIDKLDPSIYGVIVEDENSTRRGLLLPDIAGIETVEQQVSIAARKAGIAPGTQFKLSRFRVERFREVPQSN